MHKSKSGFTIVELLIVIVVIGILAAITIVTYNGIQNRAYAVKVASAVDDWKDVLEIYRTKSANDQYPPNTSSSLPYSCLGDNFPADSTFGAGQCYIQSGSLPYATFNADPTLMTALKTISDGLPDSIIPTISINSGGSTIVARGVIYISFGKSAGLVYYLKGENQTCPRGTANSQSGITACTYTIS